MHAEDEALLRGFGVTCVKDADEALLRRFGGTCVRDAGEALLRRIGAGSAAKFGATCVKDAVKPCCGGRMRRSCSQR